jgi:hypothetical protein
MNTPATNRPSNDMLPDETALEIVLCDIERCIIELSQVALPNVENLCRAACGFMNELVCLLRRLAYCPRTLVYCLNSLEDMRNLACLLKELAPLRRCLYDCDRGWQEK